VVFLNTGNSVLVKLVSIKEGAMIFVVLDRGNMHLEGMANA
jgi:hypothetical protein